MATILRLGDFEFAGLEVPASIPMPGEQDAAVHKLVGGGRVVDAMGYHYGDLVWSARFQGAGASARARQVDAIFAAGKAVVCSWSDNAFLVLPQKFEPAYEASYQIPYSLTLVVVKRLSGATPTQAAAPSLGDTVKADMRDATTLSDKIADPPLSGLMTTLDSAIAKVSDFANAAQATINSVLDPLAAAQERITTLIGSVGNTLANVTTVGGLIPGNPLSTLASNLTSQVAAMAQAPDLYDLSSLLDRIGGNVAAGGAAGAEVTVAGGDLYHLAGKVYGDPAAWTDIARANGLTDPSIEGVATLRLPTVLSGSDGVPTP